MNVTMNTIRITTVRNVGGNYPFSVEPNRGFNCHRKVCRWKNKYQSSEQRLETENDVLDNIRDLTQRIQNRLALNNPRLAERYLKAELHLLIYFRIGEIGEEFVACLQRKQIVSDSKENIGDYNVLVRQRGPSRKQSLDDGSEIHAPVVGTNRDQQTVFIDVVKLAETPEDVIPTLIWFERVDSVDGRLFHARYFSCSVGFVLRGIRGIGNREGGLSVGCPTADDNQVVDQMVKCAPQIVEGIPCDRRQPRRGLADADEIIDQLSSLRVTLGPDYVWVGHRERADFRLKITDVLFGPFDLYADKIVSLVSGHAVCS